MIAFLFTLVLQQAPPASADADTKAWWNTTTQLSSDSMEGRDTGSPGYQRAAELVAKKLAAAGVQPMGENGTWFQTVSLQDVSVTKASVSVGDEKLRFLHDIYVSALQAPAELDAPVVYRGYCAADALGDVRGKLVICHGANRPGLPSDADRITALTSAGAAGAITIADPGFTVEPPRWPFAYSRTVTQAGSAPRSTGLLNFRLNADALGRVIAGSGQDAASLIAAGSAGKPLPTFDAPGRLRASFTTTRRALSSPNVIGLLPGTDPAKANEAIVLSAHLDGYGYGEPVKGDSLYNGTLDDAAYVALLVRLAERRAGKGFRRPIVFAIVTGEEKGLHGSSVFVANPTIPKERIAANINLDQLRPLFPLELLTVHALDDTSLGDDAREVASGLGVTVQNDPEPERRLLMRSDHWNFLRAGIPAVNFVFGFRPGTESERIYRRWYREGYHTPQDDLNQHIDWKAAADFNRFYYALVERVADKETAPAWKPTSKLRPTAK